MFRIMVLFTWLAVCICLHECLPVLMTLVSSLVSESIAAAAAALLLLLLSLGSIVNCDQWVIDCTLLLWERGSTAGPQREPDGLSSDVA